VDLGVCTNALVRRFSVSEMHWFNVVAYTLIAQVGYVFLCILLTTHKYFKGLPYFFFLNQPFCHAEI